MRFLFWNTNNNYIDNYISDIIVEKQIDVFCAAEYVGDLDCLGKQIKSDKVYEEILTPNCERISILGNAECFSPGYHNKYCSMQIIDGKLLLCAVHLPSQLYNDDGRREVIIQDILNEIERYESIKGNSNTIIIGDLNVNPYDDACLSVNKFHSIPVDYEAKRLSRVFAGKLFKMFYNPMWNLFGDEKTVPGTYYCDTGRSVCPYWNMFDQVLIRPTLINYFRKDKLKIITYCNGESLLDENNHPRQEISDHLPIVFELEV